MQIHKLDAQRDAAIKRKNFHLKKGEALLHSANETEDFNTKRIFIEKCDGEFKKVLKLNTFIEKLNEDIVNISETM